ncbi:hypothetical protein WJX82_000543 [Trebouxia sp. C0006]
MTPQVISGSKPLIRFETGSHTQTGHAQASAAFQAAQHTQHTQHGAGFVLPPPPPPAIPNFSNGPRSFAVTAQTDTWNRGSVNLDDDFWCDSPRDHAYHVRPRGRGAGTLDRRLASLDRMFQKLPPGETRRRRRLQTISQSAPALPGEPRKCLGG